MQFHRAKICIQGHVIDYGVEKISPFCSICGSEVLSKCLSCGYHIRGSHKLFGFYAELQEAEEENMEYPNYCYNCGDPFPWTKSLLDNAVEILALDSQWDDNFMQIISSSIPDLLVSTPSSAIAVAKYNINIEKFTLPVRNAMYQLLFEVVSESVKSRIFPGN